MTGGRLETLLAASAVAIDGRAILIRGASGAGKSELALMLIDRGGLLVSDDQVAVSRRGDGLFAAPAPNIAGKIEVRNLGIIAMAAASDIPVALSVRLEPDAPRWIDHPERLELLGLAIPEIALFRDSPALAIKAELALQRYGLDV